ncbi:hypothetical protein GY45DRAFT_1264373 [Cubamyces sp. BRFM 1775]|nr:hypothetical protein GY45DRAFT_1264373 [Cubamyces sp. BRFM 1775]
MKRKDAKTPLTAEMTADPDDVSAFDPADGPCCTIANFRPDLSAKPRSVWNRSVIEVFVERFMAQHGEADEERVEELFTGHLKYLCDKWQAAVSKDEKTRCEIQKLANRAERQRNVSARMTEIRQGVCSTSRQLYYRRLGVAHTYAPLRHHIPMLEALGVHGMSSDESDHRNGAVQYGVFKKEWRNPAITKWLRVFDSLYRRLRLNEASHSTPGSHPHLRFYSDKQSSRHPPVKNLPRNAYDPEWLAGLNQYDIKLLGCLNVTYNFTHHPDMERYGFSLTIQVLGSLMTGQDG